MIISAINALTLSPALCAVFLSAAWPETRPDAPRAEASIARATATSSSCARSHVSRCTSSSRWRRVAGAGWLFKAVPTGFLPSEDQGAVFGGCNCRGRVGQSHRRGHPSASKIVRSTPGIEHVTSIVGYSMIDGLTKSNSAVLVMTLKPFGERKDAALSANGIIARLQREFHGIQEAVAFAYNLPPIIGLGTGSGFEYQLLSQGGGSPVDLAAVARGLVFAANQEPTLERVFTTYNANTPSSTSTSTARSCRRSGSTCPVFNALQSVLGSSYVNDFNLFGRTWQCRSRARASDRAKVADIFRINVRNKNNDMVSIRALRASA